MMLPRTRGPEGKLVVKIKTQNHRMHRTSGARAATECANLGLVSRLSTATKEDAS